jgi:FixJ family two-component response regulator
VDAKIGPKFVHLVDDDPTFCSTVEGQLIQRGFTVRSYASAQHLLDSLPDSSLPSCIVLDVRLRGMSGPELQQRLKELGSTVPIVFVSAYPDVQTTVGTIKAGGEDFLLKPVPTERIVEAIERAMSRHAAVLTDKHAKETLLSRLATLTPRERQVFERIIRGDRNGTIAQGLGITERTVKAHRLMVMEKMRIRSLAELVSLVQRLGILDH